MMCSDMARLARNTVADRSPLARWTSIAWSTRLAVSRSVRLPLFSNSRRSLAGSGNGGGVAGSATARRSCGHWSGAPSPQRSQAGATPNQSASPCSSSGAGVAMPLSHWRAVLALSCAPAVRALNSRARVAWSRVVARFAQDRLEPLAKARPCLGATLAITARRPGVRVQAMRRAAKWGQQQIADPRLSFQVQRFGPPSDVDVFPEMQLVCLCNCQPHHHLLPCHRVAEDSLDGAGREGEFNGEAVWALEE